MKNIIEITEKKVRPEKIIQFGEGGFLRGFVDWMLQKANDSGKYCGNVVIVQPIEKGMCAKLEEQNCLYTHIIRGCEGVEKTLVDSVSRCINPYSDYDEYLKLAKNPDFNVIVSNTTEAGISWHDGDKLSDRPQVSYPAKLTALLYERFKSGLDGFLVLPCELIEKNGSKLKEYVLKWAKVWSLGEEFINWVKSKNCFCNTLVDRIVTGYPKEEKIELGYEDNMVNTSEYFHLWVIEGDKSYKNRLPFDELGLNIIWTDELERYRTRKVRILNGAHTSMVPYAMLKGFKTVGECMANQDMLAYVKKCIFEEIIPTLDLPKEELESYAEDVLTRFKNPYIKHYLSSIALNSVSKFKVRVLPSISEYRKRFGENPKTLIVAFAALIKFYRTDMPNDDTDVMNFMKTAPVSDILKNDRLWGMDLSCLIEYVDEEYKKL